MNSQQSIIPDTLNRIVLPLGTFMLSIAIYFGTRDANAADRASKANAQCHNGTIQLLSQVENLIDEIESGGVAQKTQTQQGSASNNSIVAKAQRIDVSAQFVEQDCAEAKSQIPLGVQRSLCQLGRLIPDNDVKASLTSTADEIVRRANAQELLGCGVATTKAVVPAATAPSQQQSFEIGRAVPQKYQPSAKLAIYIQYPKGTPADQVEYIRGQVAKTGLLGHRTLVPPAQAVAPPSSSTLRCLKVSDCAYAAQVASELAATLGLHNLQVLDLGARYNARTDIRNGVFELWLAPDTVRQIELARTPL